MVGTGCSQTMVQADLVPPQIGSPEAMVSICIHGSSYTYERRWMKLTVMGWMAKLAVGLAKTLPCLMLLGVDWRYLHEVLDRAIQVQSEEDLTYESHLDCYRNLT